MQLQGKAGFAKQSANCGKIIIASVITQEYLFLAAVHRRRFSTPKNMKTTISPEFIAAVSNFRLVPQGEPVRHSIRITCVDGSRVYLSHRGKNSFAPTTAREYLAQWLAANPGGVARVENQFQEPVPSAARLESRARRLYALHLVDPRAPQYALADSLMDQARMVRA